jgi:hypothetical protein
MEQYSYDVRVKARSGGPTYLWGGPKIQKPLAGQFFLNCRVDDLGESVSIRLKTSGEDIQYGELGPSQTITIPLSNGVFVSATPSSENGDSLVCCTILK